jgi:hypothetical protein
MLQIRMARRRARRRDLSGADWAYDALARVEGDVTILAKIAVK